MSSRPSRAHSQSLFQKFEKFYYRSGIRGCRLLIIFSLLSFTFFFIVALFFMPQYEQAFQYSNDGHISNLENSFADRVNELEIEIKKQRQNFEQTLLKLKKTLHMRKTSGKASDSSKDINILLEPKGNFALDGSNVDHLEIQGGTRPANETIARYRDQVKEMMKHAWSNYVKYAWGGNELRPITKQPHNNIIFGRYDLGATLVDGLDTLFIMGLQEEYKAGRDWIAQHLHFDVDTEVSVFEFNIRFLGSFLTLYSFTGDKLYVDKAVELADRLLPAFNTPTGLPMALINLKTGSSRNYQWASAGSSILSEFGTLHMEFAFLSELTGNDVYLKKVKKIRDLLQQAGSRPHGLYPNYLHPRTLQWGQMHSSLAGMGDSFYEYLLKENVRTGGQDTQARELYDDAMRSMEKWMFKRSHTGLLYVGDYKYGRVENKMDHLACFGGGMFVLGANTSTAHSSPTGKETITKWMTYGEDITRTCRESYVRTVTQLGPESFHFTTSFEAQAMQPRERGYLLRPETVESYFYLWRFTHNPKYREWAWDFLQALEKHCRVDGGFTGISDVNVLSSKMDDVMQSYFLAETLKYLYLVFSEEDILPLHRWVFNSEAHPLPIRGRVSLPFWS